MLQIDVCNLAAQFVWRYQPLDGVGILCLCLRL